MEAANLRSVRMHKSESPKYLQVSGAAFRSVDLSALSLSAGQISAAFGDASVILPKGVVWPSHWPDWELPQIGKYNFEAPWKKWQTDPAGYVPPPRPAKGRGK